MMPTKPVYFAVLVYLQLITIQVTLCQTVPSAASPTSLEIKCEYYDKSKCESTDIQSCTTVETCLSDEKPGHCFVLWREDATGNVSVAMKGCFTENQICNQTECVDTNSPNNKKNAIKFCCCSGSMCNRQHKWVPMTTEFPEAEVPVVAPQSDRTLILLLIIISIVTTAVCICTAGLIYKNRRSSFNQIPTTDTEPTSAMGTELEPLSIKLLEVKARGRFGTVWKAQMLPEEVAVKIFPIQDKQSWSTEQDIFMLPKMNHQNILKFIGASKKEENGELSLWLVTSYHPNGSLCDYLKSHTVTWPEMCKIAESMAKGLMHLHEEIINKNDGTKPSIAHRDFKSKNVLLKDDLTACIADFGLALVFKPGVPCGDTHGQVGTRRYMAPEILEGAINFTRDAFLRIDVYACGLVLWELVSRCTAHGGIVSDYTLPFEVELGPHPSLEEMQENVVAKKLRPKIQDHWRTHTGLSSICDTMEECWDHDAEARLSSSCVVERISQHIKYSGSTQLLIETNSPRFKEANNII